MSDAEHRDVMDVLQFSGHPVMWFVHRMNHFNKRRGFYSRVIAEAVARQGEVVTPYLDD